MSYIKTGDVENKISAESLNNWDGENRLKLGVLDESWIGFENLRIWGQVQRRGARVNTPEIGSRVGEFCFGGI
jgi:hypothetical protein